MSANETLEEFLQLEKTLGQSVLSNKYNGNVSTGPGNRSGPVAQSPQRSHQSSRVEKSQELDAFFQRASTLLTQLDEQIDPVGFRYCESCSDGVENDERKPAKVFCRQCGGHLCEDCDREYHPKRNALMRKHKRTPVEQLRATIYCKAHPEDEVTYFCLDCESACVCTECVVHGPHKTHNVQQINKAYPIVKAKVEHLLSTINARQEEVAIMETKIQAHRQEILDNSQSIKESMAQSFNEVRERLRKKEAELLANADAFCEEQCIALDHYIKAARDKAEQIDVAAEIVRTRLSDNDQVSLMNYYADHRNDMVELASTKPPIPDLPQVANRKCFLNMDATNAQIESLNGLHLIIATLKGIDTEDNGSPLSTGGRQHSGAKPSRVQPSFSARR